jgi:hypothetical protein
VGRPELNQSQTVSMSEPRISLSEVMIASVSWTR